MTTHQLLTTITLTGVDDRTNLAEIVNLSERFPLVEWGFLYSPKRQGQGGRYPSVATLFDAFRTLPETVRVALHVCGAGVPNLLSNEAEVTGLVEAVAGRGGRVQLNFSQSRDSIDLDALSALLDHYPSLKVITQHNDSNEDVWKRLCGHANYVVLFDSSGGRGVERNSWPAPLHGIHCGYAGGLGPDNLATELTRIRAATRGQAHWIDMEGKLRTQDDIFDLQRAEACLRKAMSSLCLDWMSPEEVRAAVRFCETCDDDEAYDVPRAMMKQLEAFGLVVDKKVGRFEQTSLLLDIRETLEAEITAAS